MPSDPEAGDEYEWVQIEIRLECLEARHIDAVQRPRTPAWLDLLQLLDERGHFASM